MSYENEWHRPWPIKALIDHLCRGSNLRLLIEPRRDSKHRDVREYQLENIAKSVLVEGFGRDRVIVQKPLSRTFNISENDFPANTRPDLVVYHQGFFHICELKSSRKDYNRYHSVVGRAFREYLDSVGYGGQDPYEVEQDLIKLHQSRTLSNRVGSCLFLMLDAYVGTRWSWTEAFQEKTAFLDRMRTDLIRDMADQLLESTQIKSIDAKGTSANLITCVVHSWE